MSLKGVILHGSYELSLDQKLTQAPKTTDLSSEQTSIAIRTRRPIKLRHNRNSHNPRKHPPRKSKRTLQRNLRENG